MPKNQTFGNTMVFEKHPDVALVYRLFSKGRLIEPQREFATDRLRTEFETAASAKGVKLCADGDSWINILWPMSSAFGHEKTFFDVLEESYFSNSAAWPGDTFEEILQEKDYLTLIRSGIYDFFIFSGGGNDVLGGSALVKLLKRKDAGGNSSDPTKYLNNSDVERVLSSIKAGYLNISNDVKEQSKKTMMFVHGYDYPVPVKGEPWLAKPFEKRGYDLQVDKVLISDILGNLVDRFYSTLGQVADNAENVKVINLRGIVNGRWNDELHPKKEASEDIALEYIKVIGPVMA